MPGTGHLRTIPQPSKRPVITLRAYAHMWPGDEDRTRNVLDAALSPPGQSIGQ